MAAFSFNKGEGENQFVLKVFNLGISGLEQSEKGEKYFLESDCESSDLGA